MSAINFDSKAVLVSTAVREIISVLLGTVFLSIASWVSVPLFPIPVTMQTYAVLLIGSVYGARLASMTILAWLGEACLGLPVLAGGASGALHLIGSRGGYFLGFLVSAWVIGKYFERKTQAHTILSSISLMLIGHAIILAFGFIWLAQFVNLKNAFYLGVMPFLSGTVLKSVFAALTLRLLRRAN